MQPEWSWHYAVYAYFAGLVSLFPMVNPFSTIPLLLALMRGRPNGEIKQQGTRASLYAGILMLATVFLGSTLLEFFKISVPALKIAGGLIVAFIGFRMLFPQEEEERRDQARQSVRRKDFSFVPLAMPSLSGAGTLALLISFSAHVHTYPAWETRSVLYVLALAVIVSLTFLSIWILRSSTWISAKLGPDGFEAMERVMGLLLVCLGVQFIGTGVETFGAAAP